jgi:hypothetical protein
MPSPLVRRLLTSIDECRDPETRACFIAELGCYWARVGEFQQAEQLCRELRRDFADRVSVRVSVLIMCIEALLMYFRELSPLARRRMAGAHVLSTAARDSRLIAFTSAWMAHIDFNQNRFETMVSAAADCLSVIDADDGTAECRLSLVLGDAFLFARELTCSDRWYARSRAAANRIGDHAAIGALTYNRAALHVAAARFQQASGSQNEADIDLVMREVQSAINYQAIAHLRSLDHLLTTANIGVLILQKRFADVMPMINQMIESGDVPPESAQLTLLQADLALSLAWTGQTDSALKIVDSLKSISIDKFSPDDRALIWYSISRATEICAAPEYISDFTSKLEIAVEEHNEAAAKLAALLAPFK